MTPLTSQDFRWHHLRRTFLGVTNDFISPTILEPFFGRLCFSSCGRRGTATDRRRHDSHARITYWAPAWLSPMILDISLVSSLTTPPMLSLRNRRRVPDSALAVSLTISGNLSRLETLFAEGLASPWDVTTTRGYSLLMVSSGFGKPGNSFESSVLILPSGLCMLANAALTDS